MFWSVDIGNSRAVSGYMRGIHPVRKTFVETSRLRTLSGALRWAKGLQKKGPGEGFIIASVVPAVDGMVRMAVEKASGQAPFFVNPLRNPGISIHYRKPREVGADRIVNSIAAKKIFGAPVIVVDYGTATTFDVVDGGGAYRGGVIWPGIGMSLKALHQQTAKLPLVTFAKTRSAVGTTTKDGIRSGLYLGTLGATREILSRIRKQLGSTAPAVATGGFCRLFEGTGLYSRIEPDLTLKGLAMIWNERFGV